MGLVTDLSIGGLRAIASFVGSWAGVLPSTAILTLNPEVLLDFRLPKLGFPDFCQSHRLTYAADASDVVCIRCRLS